MERVGRDRSAARPSNVSHSPDNVETLVIRSSLFRPISFAASFHSPEYNKMNTSAVNSLYFPLFDQYSIMNYSFDRTMDANATVTLSVNYAPFYRVIIRGLSIYALFLVIIGTLGNLSTIIVLCRRNLIRYVTMRYLIAVSVCDLVSLYGWNLNNFYKFTISGNDSNLEQISLAHCRIVSYVTFVGLQLSSWCLTAVSIGR